jgi:hypothetical protein
MHTHSTLTRPFAVLVVLAVLAAFAVAVPGASAAPSPRTGTWSGTTEQDLGLDEPYTTRIVIKALRGRIISVAAEIRMQCDDDTILDARVFKSYRVRRGPELSRRGAFSLKVKPNGQFSTTEGRITISGTLARRGGDGNASAQAGSCRGNGTWSADRIN